ncbi:MAG: tRNA lysidine(34) synthetase TilS [Ilyomonas sp.]
MLLQKFQQHLKNNFPEINKNTCVLLAVSGGIDSVVLTDLFAKSGLDFIIVHCNFKLRREESDRDEAFVRALGNKYNEEVLVKTFDTNSYASANKTSIQEAARKLRYDWFYELLDKKIAEKRATYIVTAHHANDNIETLLINFFRGTGITGLHGIPAKQNKILRPLLFASREEILAYAQKHDLRWVEDSSNLSEKYTRNFFRLKLLPELKEIFPSVEENLKHNLERFEEAEILYYQAVDLHKKKLIEQKGNELHIPVLKLQKTEPQNTIIFEIIKDFGFTSAQVNEVKKLYEAENGSYIASASHRIIKNRNWLIIAPLQTTEAQHILIEAGDKKVQFENGLLELEKLPVSKFEITNSKDVVYVDAKEITFPLLLRKWKQGNYFYPLGMQKKKKLSKFFIDQKLSKTQKENVWVIEMNKKIIWVIGYRIDNRFKVTDSTTNVIKLVWRNPV